MNQVVYILKDKMNFKHHKKQILLSSWWLLEACALYYYFASFGLGVIIISLSLIFISCLLLLFRSYKIRAFSYLLLSIYSVGFLLGMCILYLFSMRIEQHIGLHIFICIIIVANIWISFREFWNNWKKCLPL